VARLPSVNNVFGYLRSTVGLQPVAEVLRSRLGLDRKEARVMRSSESGAETLIVETSVCLLQTHPAPQGDTWRFDGAVAGNAEEIFATLLPLVNALGWAGFRTSFEMYDASFQFIGDCPRREN